MRDLISIDVAETLAKNEGYATLVKGPPKVKRFGLFLKININENLVSMPKRFN